MGRNTITKRWNKTQVEKKLWDRANLISYSPSCTTHNWGLNDPPSQTVSEQDMTPLDCGVVESVHKIVGGSFSLQDIFFSEMFLAVTNNESQCS